MRGSMLSSLRVLEAETKHHHAARKLAKSFLAAAFCSFALIRSSLNIEQPCLPASDQRTPHACPRMSSAIEVRYQNQAWHPT